MAFLNPKGTLKITHHIDGNNMNDYVTTLKQPSIFLIKLNM